MSFTIGKLFNSFETWIKYYELTWNILTPLFCCLFLHCVDFLMSMENYKWAKMYKLQ